MPAAQNQLPYILFILSLFAMFGASVRQGRIPTRHIIGYGALIGTLATGATAWYWWPYNGKPQPLYIALFYINIVAMLLVTAFCVYVSVRSQRVESVATYALGDTTVYVQVCPPQRVPDAHAMLIPTDTSLRLADGVAGYLGLVTGAPLSRELRTAGPVNLGHVVATSGGRTAVGKIFHVAVSDSFKPVDKTRLRQGIEKAGQAARKHNAESVIVPVAAMRGLSVAESAEAILGGILKQHRAFAEIVIAIFDPRDRDTVAGVVRSLLQAEGAELVEQPAQR